MKFKQRLEMFTGQYMFIKWVGGSEYVKLMNVGDDFYEFDVIDIENRLNVETLTCAFFVINCVCNNCFCYLQDKFTTGICLI